MQSSSQLHTTHTARFHEYLDSSPLEISLAALYYFKCNTRREQVDWQ